MKICYLLLVLFLCCFMHADAQKKSQVKIDSMRAIMLNARPDSAQQKLYGEIARYFVNINADSGIKYARLSLQLANKANKKLAICQSLNTLGLGFKVKGNFAEAIQTYHLALKGYGELHDSAGLSKIYNNIGNLYNYKKNYEEARKYYFQSLAIRMKLKDRNGTGACYNNIGLSYFNQDNYTDALRYYQSAHDILVDGGDKQYLSNAIGNIGDIKMRTGKYKEAEIAYAEALKMRFELDDPTTIASSYISLGELYGLMERPRDAEKYCLKALDICHSLGSPKLIADCCGTLSGIYEKIGDYKLSKKYYIEHIAARDSMFNSENERKLMEQQMQFEYDKKQALAHAEQLRHDAVATERLMREKNTKRALLGGVILLVIIAGIAIYAFRQKRRDNVVIQRLVNEQEQVIADRTRELAEANTDLEETNHKLVELIQYNAHQVREPLTRITGVMGVMDAISQEEFVEEVWPLIQKAVYDLDTNIKKVIEMAGQNE